MRVLFVTNVPAPYRIDFFNALGRRVDLTVCFERRNASDRHRKWVKDGPKEFKEIYAKAAAFGADRSIGTGIAAVIRQTPFDALILSGYSSPSVMYAILCCRLHKIAYYIESDGGFYQKENPIKRWVKRLLLCGAKAHFTTCDAHIQYLQSIGIAETQIYKYPFSSVKQEELLPAIPSVQEKKALRASLGMTEDKIVLSVGQFIHRKGYDVLLKAAAELPKEIGIYIIGGTPAEAYLALQKSSELHQVHFMDFMDREALMKWYRAADCFVLPTREDIWGLVVNEALANGLPVITTDRCAAGLELLQEGACGVIVPAEDSVALGRAIQKTLQDGYPAMAEAGLAVMRAHTIEAMAQKHIEVLTEEGIV